MKIKKHEQKQKGNNGHIAEYVSTHTFAEEMTARGFVVLTDLKALKDLRDERIEFYSERFSEEETIRAINQGIAQGQELVDIWAVQNGKDQIVTPYPFYSIDHSFDIEGVGHDTSREGSEDIVLTVRKIIKPIVAYEILYSLKASKSPKTSQGSKSSVPHLVNCFGDIDGIEELENEINLFKGDCNEWYNSTEGKLWFKKYKEDRGNPNIKLSKINPKRRGEVGEYFYKKRGYHSNQRLAELFVKFYNKGLSQKVDWKKYVKGMIAATSFDDVITISAIAKNVSVDEVILSTQSPGYAKVYKAFKNPKVYFNLEYTGTGSIKVQMIDDDVIINSFTLQMWMDGTMQYTFNSKK